MGALFISHSSRDTAQAEELAERLRGQGHRSLFLDFDPEAGIPAGRDWEQELYRALRVCRAVIVLCSPAALDSRWCFAEITQARALGKQLFPLIVAPCELPAPLDDTQAIDLTRDREKGYLRLWRGLKEAGIDPADAAQWQEDRPPYPGLMAFDEADAPVFFGREAAIRDAMDALTRMGRYGEPRLLLLLGASGSGKSSLARAGLIPRLRRSPAWLVVDPVRPRGDPMEALAIQLSRAFRRSGETRPWEGLRGRLSGERPGALAGIARDLSLAADSPDARPLLLIDQFEELLQQETGGGSDTVLTLLADSLEEHKGRLILLATLRSDYLAAFQSNARLAGLPYDTLTLGPMLQSDLIEVVTGPTRVVPGLELEPGLAETLVADAGRQDALPLLAFTLRELWENAGEGRLLSLSAYREKLGGMEGAIKRAADGAVDSLRPDQRQLQALQRAFRRLVRINEEGRFTRRAALWRELPAESLPLLQRLVDARLLVSGKSAEKGEEGAYDSLEVAHEALFRVWGQLARWLEQDREFLLWRHRLAAAIESWLHAQRDPEALLRGGQLAEAEGWLKERVEDLTETQRGFVEAGLERHREQEEAKEAARRHELQQAQALAEARRRSARRSRIIAAVTAVGLAIAISLGALAWQQSRVATGQLAGNHWISGITARDERDDPVRAVLHFMTAARLLSDTAGGRSAFFAGEVLNGGVRLQEILEQGSPVKGAVFGPGGRLVLSWDESAQVRLWNAVDGEAIFSVQHQAKVRGGRFTADGRVLWWSNDGLVVLRGLTADAVELRIRHDGQAKGARLAPDGRRLLTWSGEAAHLRDPTDGRELNLLAHPGLREARFNTNGSRVFTWGKDGLVRIWDGADGTLLGELNHQDDVHGIALAPDEGGATSLVSWGDGGKNSRARFWDLTLYAEFLAPTVLPEWEEGVRSATFLADGWKVLVLHNFGKHRIVDLDPASLEFGESTSLGDPLQGAVLHRSGDTLLFHIGGRLRVIDLLTKRQGLEFPAPPGLQEARFIEKGRRLLLWGRNNEAQLRDAQTGQLIALPLVHSELSGSTAASGGERFLTWGGDGALRLWALQGSQPLAGRTPDAGTVLAAAAEGDGAQLVLVTEEGISDWDLSDDKRGPVVSLEFMTPVRPEFRFRFSPDSTRLLGEVESGFRIWDRQNGRSVAQFQGPNRSLNHLVMDRSAEHILHWDQGLPFILRPVAAAAEPVVLAGKNEILEAGFSADSKHILARNAEFQLRIWRVDDIQPLGNRIAYQGLAGVLQGTAGGPIVTWGDDKRVRVWGEKGTAPLLELSHDQPIVEVVADFPRGRLLVRTADHKAQLWGMENREKPIPALEHPEMSGADFSHDGSRLLTWGGGRLRLWDAATGRPLTPALYHRNKRRPARAAFGTDAGTPLVWGREEVRVWHLAGADASPSPDPLLAQQRRCGCRLDERGELELLTAQEWRQLQGQATVRPD